MALALTIFAVMALIGTAHHPEGWRRFDLMAYVLTGLICLPLAARRIAPTATLVVVSLAYTAYVARGYLPNVNFYAPMVAFYTVATMKKPRETAVGALLFGASLFYSGLMTHGFSEAVGVAQAVAAPAVVWLLAGVSRRLSLRNRQLAEATEQLRREQEHRVEHAITQERLQIARELHDVVAHHLSVAAMHAGLARYAFDSDPPTARAAVDTVNDITRETLEELRRVLQLLRTSDTPTKIDTEAGESEPAPGIARLEALIDRVRGVGVNATLEITGAIDELPSGLQVTVYRVVQEALTNVIKHAGPSQASVVLHRDCRQLTVTVTNDKGPVAEPAATIAPTDGGYGLLGMRERARLYGGTLTAGPRPDGGYIVVLTVPWPSSVTPLHQ
ncbi:sensor histidine kinase [Nocardia brasiliensis]|uniref:sensor histidine kinase n=1 Tax=Nocardia brasiliensis TaxID=37326 RepID=UPI00366BF519